MKSFVALVLTFVIVYWLTPWVAYHVLNRTAPGYYGAAIGLLAVWIAYSILRRIFGDRLPHI